MGAFLGCAFIAVVIAAVGDLIYGELVRIANALEKQNKNPK